MGIYFRNSNGKITQVKKSSSQTIVNFMATGGVLEFYIFYGDSAEEIIKNYHVVIGKPVLPPFWALGYF